MYLRLFGSIIVAWDVCTKIAYYNFSRFSSAELKQIYYTFLLFRPFLLGGLFLYNICLGFKAIFVEKEMGSKKFKDDIAF